MSVLADNGKGCVNAIGNDLNLSFSEELTLLSKAFQEKKKSFVKCVIYQFQNQYKNGTVPYSEHWADFSARWKPSW